MATPWTISKCDGNAINTEIAKEFIGAYRETQEEIKI